MWKEDNCFIPRQRLFKDEGLYAYWGQNVEILYALKVVYTCLQCYDLDQNNKGQLWNKIISLRGQHLSQLLVELVMYWPFCALCPVFNSHYETYMLFTGPIQSSHRSLLVSPWTLIYFFLSFLSQTITLWGCLLEHT